MRMKNFRVPGHDIKVSLSELLFINTAIFQRLNNIKQLGLAYLVYPFALHTRASHCIDTLHMAQQFIEHLKANIEHSTLLEKEKREEILEALDEDLETIRATAILHDITHIPYAHTLEDEICILSKGDKGKRINTMIKRLEEELKEFRPNNSSINLADYRIFSFPNSADFNKTLKHAKNILKDVKKVLWTIALHDRVEELVDAEKTQGTLVSKIYNKVKKKVEEETTIRIREISDPSENVKMLKAERYYISDIIGNTLSADLLSYILRDPELTGIETKPGGWYRILDYLEIVKDDVGRNRLVIKLTKKGEWRQDVFSTIIRILNARYDLTEQVYYHHAKLSASAMLGKLAYLCDLSEGEEGLYDVGDEGFFELLERRIEDIKEGKINSRTMRDAEGAEKLLKSLRCRRLHKRFHVITKIDFGRIDLSVEYSNPKNRWDLEEHIEGKYNLTPGSIILFCPKRKVSSKEATAMVAYEEKPESGFVVKPLNSPDCLSFLRKEKHPSLANRVENVQKQYEGLWKLYVFVDPIIIPIYGKEIKNTLDQKLGPSTSFDLSYLELMEEYKLSKEVAQKVTETVPELDREEVFKNIPTAITQISGRDRKALSVNWIKTNLGNIIQASKEMACSSKETQRTLQ